MKLLHSNQHGEDIGIIRDFEFDLAYGQDENNFTMTIPLTEHSCSAGDILHMIDESLKDERYTEYGGVIDAINVNTTNQTVTYKGRTGHGILAGKIIEPESGQDYYTVSGNAHDIINEVLERVGLDLAFSTPSEDSPINIVYYQFPRYVDAYTGIRDMLYAFGGKLKLVYNGNAQVLLSAVWLTDYSIDDEWDSSQVKFQAEVSINNVNHLICLGQGDLKERYVIHLYTDENGGIQPYANVAEPIYDSDYILDNSSQRILWTFEICDVLDYPNAAFKDNYVLLTTQPADWDENFMEYYYLDATDSKFKSAEMEEDAEYEKLDSAPADWNTSYANYFTSQHKSVEGIESTTYTRLTKKPTDWDQNYGNYFIRQNGSYVPVTYVASIEYQTLTEKPSNWQTAYASYYKRKVNSSVVMDADGNVAKDGKFTRVSKTGDGYEAVSLVHGSVPEWKTGRYFRRVTQNKSPKFNDGVNKYKVTKTVSAPTWAENTYYTKTSDGKLPSFKTGTYYRLVVDHYADLVKKGLERLKKLNKRISSIKINLDLQGEYDIGDIVGAREEITGIEVWQPIVKKIVSIDKRGKRISYKVGET